jgi:hypothetical protein
MSETKLPDYQINPDDLPTLIKDFPPLYEPLPDPPIEPPEPPETPVEPDPKSPDK